MRRVASVDAYTRPWPRPRGRLLCLPLPFGVYTAEVRTREGVQRARVVELR